MRAVASIHQRDWRTVTPDEVPKLLPLQWERIEAEIPPDSKYKTSECDGSVYLKHDGENASLSFEFRKTSRRDCEPSLHSVWVSIGESPDVVAGAHVLLLSSLNATGPVCGDVEQYRWRSDDSSTLYDLQLAKESEPGVSGLALRLTHTNVLPETVDGLPFRKGYFPPDHQPPPPP